MIAEVLLANLVQARRRRARRLAGSRGGRPCEDPLQFELKRLIAADESGDPDARQRLLMADALLRRWLDRAVQRPLEAPWRAAS